MLILGEKQSTKIKHFTYYKKGLAIAKPFFVINSSRVFTLILKKPSALRTVLVSKSNKTIIKLFFHKHISVISFTSSSINGNRHSKVRKITFNVGFMRWAV